MEEILKYLTQILSNSDSVVLAVSGGPDSMCLLHILLKLKKEKNLQLICAHVNHNVRSVSDSELEFVKSFCQKNDVIFEPLKIEKYHQDNFHEEARKIRYDFFESLIKKYRADYLMTAHHGDDLMETILMRLTRGSTLKGCAGFEKSIVKENYTLVRPLITLTKEAILKYNQENSIIFVEDESNETDHYTRNRFRHHLLPFLKEENPFVHQKFLKFSQELFHINELLVKSVHTALTNCMVNDTLHIVELSKLDSLIQREVIKEYLYHIYGNQISVLEDIHVDNLLNFIYSDKTTGSISLPLKYIAYKNYGELVICFEKKTEKKEVTLSENTVWSEKEYFQKIESSNQKSNDVIRLNSEEIRLPLKLRTRKNGDFIEVKNLNGTKKVNDIFIDQKILRQDRDFYPLLVDSNDTVLWVPGLKKSKFDKEKNEKYDIIYKYVFSKEKKNESKE